LIAFLDDVRMEVPKQVILVSKVRKDIIVLPIHNLVLAFLEKS